MASVCEKLIPKSTVNVREARYEQHETLGLAAEFISTGIIRAPF